ncbi:MAG: M23 family metallopeptidase [Cytophagales bacterium]|nr:M23 family metallopeptidase [Cytophagales bacterium]
MIMKQLFSTLFIIVIITNIYAQTTITEIKQTSINLRAGYPQDFFQFPIMPNQQNFLSGNMGEIRGDHFHAGIDIRTGGKTGLPVYAVADGYVYRIKISSGGYGNVLYIAHPAHPESPGSPKGYISVYAHLEKFDGPIATYVRKKQYQNESFQIELFPDARQFPVKKGQQIGLSGNSGSSRGPHLHFEIRDDTEKALNPLYFGFDEIKDNIPPRFYKIALRTLDIRSRINGEFGRLQFIPIISDKSSLKEGNKGNRGEKEGKQSAYIIEETINVTGLIGIEIESYDQVNRSRRKMGVNFIELMIDGTLLYRYHLEKLNFNKTKNVKVHIDYETALREKRKFQKCYLADGNDLKCYRTFGLLPEQAGQKGKIFINDTLLHDVTIRIYDAYYNSAQINLTLKGAPLKFDIHGPFPPPSTTIRYNVFENILKVSAKGFSNYNSPAQIFTGKFKYELDVTYHKNNEVVWLWDLRKGLPDSMDLCGITKKMTFTEIIPSNTEFYFDNEKMSIYFPKKALFDTLYLQIISPPKSPSAKGEGDFSALQSNMAHEQIYEINDPAVPLYKNIYITLKPKREVFDKAKTRVYYIEGKDKYAYTGGVWQDNKIKFKTRHLGKFVLLADTIAPIIKVIIKNSQEVKVKIDDDLSGIKSFIARVNDKWLLMNYDHKSKLLWSERSDKKVPLKGEFKITVTDNAGNVRTQITQI